MGERCVAEMFLVLLLRILEMQTKINLGLSRAAIDMQSKSVWPGLAWSGLVWRIPGVLLYMH